MNKNFDKEVAKTYDEQNKHDCINLSVGPNNKDQYAWCASNMRSFIEQSENIYKDIILHFAEHFNLNGYLVDFEEKPVISLLSNYDNIIKNCSSKIIVFSNEEMKIKQALQNCNSYENLFECLYNNKIIIAIVLNLYSEGNSLSFFSKSKDISEVINIAKKENFIVINSANK